MGWGSKSIFLFCFLQPVAFADNWFKPILDPVPTGDFCNLPYLAICHSRDTSVNDRQERIANLKERVRKRALEETARNLLVDPATYIEPRNAAESAVFLKHVNRITEQDIATVELDAAIGSAAIVKLYLKLAIDEQADLGNITRDAQARMKSIVDKTRVKTSTNLRTAMRSRLDFRVFSYYLTCGPDGLADNAYAALDSDGPYIMLCPGWLLRAAGGGFDRTSNFHNLLQVMAHEFAHHIDFDDFQDSYLNLTGCLIKNYSDEMRHGANAIDTTIKILEGTFAKPVSDFYKVTKHMSEISADYWAGLTVKQYLKDTPRVLRLQAVREAWSGLCGGKDEGIHPEGRFRMTVLMATDPEMRKLLGCPTRPSILGPHCSLSGALF